MDILSPFGARALVDLAACDSDAFLREAEVFVGGGVCIDPAEFMLSEALLSKESFDGVIPGPDLGSPGWVSNENDACGEDVSPRDESTGGNVTLRFEEGR